MSPLYCKIYERVKLIRFFYFQAKLLESSHAWLGASTSSIAGKCTISFKF